MTAKSWSARNKNDLIIEVWEDLDCESVGARELEQIQQALGEKFGDGALASPAAIARTVTDEGALLRHPEVFECDVKWRQQNLKKWEFREGLDFSDLSLAFESVVKIEEKRLEVHRSTGEKGKGKRETKAAETKELCEVVTAAREELLLRARSKILDYGQRRQAKEISEWLSVWLQAPELFSDWLDLRRRSAEFRKRFPIGSQNREL